MQKGEITMSKVIYCSKVNPSAGCEHIIRGDTIEEVLQRAAGHAKEHGLKPTRELLDKVKDFIEDEEVEPGQ